MSMTSTDLCAHVHQGAQQYFDLMVVEVGLLHRHVQSGLTVRFRGIQMVVTAVSPGAVGSKR